MVTAKEAGFVADAGGLQRNGKGMGWMVVVGEERVRDGGSSEA